MLRVVLSIASPLTVVIAACTPNNNALVAAPMTSDTSPPVVAAPDPPDASLGVTRPLDINPFDAGAKMCGCGLCDPLLSTDACKTDADCAPSQPCHAPACVAKAKSTPRTKDMMCTEEVRCNTTDANACGCLNGFCALHKK